MIKFAVSLLLLFLFVSAPPVSPQSPPYEACRICMSYEIPQEWTLSNGRPYSFLRVDQEHVHTHCDLVLWPGHTPLNKSFALVEAWCDFCINGKYSRLLRFNNDWFYNCAARINDGF